MSWTRSTQPKFSTFGDMTDCPEAYVDGLAMAAVECNSACPARVLKRLRKSIDRSEA